MVKPSGRIVRLSAASRSIRTTRHRRRFTVTAVWRGAPAVRHALKAAARLQRRAACDEASPNRTGPWPVPVVSPEARGSFPCARGGRCRLGAGSIRAPPTARGGRAIPQLDQRHQRSVSKPAWAGGDLARRSPLPSGTLVNCKHLVPARMLGARIHIHRIRRRSRCAKPMPGSVEVAGEDVSPARRFVSAGVHHAQAAKPVAKNAHVPGGIVRQVNDPTALESRRPTARRPRSRNNAPCDRQADGRSTPPGQDRGCLHGANLRVGAHVLHAQGFGDPPTFLGPGESSRPTRLPGGRRVRVGLAYCTTIGSTPAALSWMFRSQFQSGSFGAAHPNASDVSRPAIRTS